MIIGEKAITDQITRKKIDDDCFLYILPEGYHFMHGHSNYGRFIYEGEKVWGSYQIVSDAI